MGLYPSSGTTIRADINAVVEEAAFIDRLFIGQAAMPMVGVDAKSGTYPKLDIAGAELASPGSTLRSRSGSYGEVTRKWGTDTYDCLDRGLEEPVDDTDAKDLGRFFPLETKSARWVLRNMMIDYETRVSSALINATTFGAGTAAVVNYTEALIATINFLADVQAAQSRLNANGTQGNTVIMSGPVFDRVARSTLWQNWFRGTGQGQVTQPINAANMARALADWGIEQVLVGRLQYNAAKKGQAKSMTAAWANTYIWVGVVRPAGTITDLQNGGAGFSMVWNAEGGLFVSETYRNENRRSNMVRVRQNEVEKVVDATAGTLITTSYS